MNSLNKNKIDVTVLITSISQREITIETARYYSQICTEVILVDEQKPYLSEIDIKALKKAGIIYIPYSYNGDLHKRSLCSTYEKRLIAAKESQKKYVVHSNHDERYTYNGLLGCINELEQNDELIFCAGQAIAVRRDDLKIHYSRPQERLYGYQNINNIQQRLYYHAETYALVAHYSVWRKKSYINVTEKTISIHNQMPSTTMMEEVIFEFAANLAGNSKTIPKLYWIRNRLNSPLHNSKEKGKHVFKIIENKLDSLFEDIDNIKMNIIINNLKKNFPHIGPTFIDKTIIFIKQNVRKLVKKKKIFDIDTLIANKKITYEKDDLSNALKSIGF